MGIEAVFNYFAQDAFYYISVARNSYNNFYSFDGETATNGFHPLWQMYLTYVFSLIGAGNQTLQLWTVFAICCTMTVLGYLLCSLSLYYLSGSMLSVLIVPGLYYLLSSFVTVFYGSPWQFMNGMESSFTVFFGGILLCLISAHYRDPEKYSEKAGFWWILGIVTGLMILSRLDDVFLLPAFGVSIFFAGRNGIDRAINKLVPLIVPSAILLVCYLAYNYYSVGMLMPVSGLSKSGFALISNVSLLAGLVKLGPVQVDQSGTWVMLFYRYLQIIIPPAVCVLLISHFRMQEFHDDKNRMRNCLFISLLWYVVLKAAYNFTVVRIEDQGYSWYYVFSVIVMDFTAIFVLAGLIRQYPSPVTFKRAPAVFVVIFLLISHMILVTRHGLQTGNSFYVFWHDRHRIAGKLQSKIPNPRLVEYDDGIINYSLSFPTVHGFGFVGDFQGHVAAKQGKFLDYCLKRGFNVIASLQYIQMDPMNCSADKIRKYLLGRPWFEKEDLSRYTFELLFFDEPTGAYFIKFGKI